VIDLIDTSISSEVPKGDRCDARAATWYAFIDDAVPFLSMLALGEVRRTTELACPRDPAKAIVLGTWLVAVEHAFAERILPVDRHVPMNGIAWPRRDRFPRSTASWAQRPRYIG